MTILGADIGYSNLKVVHGAAGSASPQSVMYPAGAIPLREARAGLRGEKPRASVLVDGAPWVAGLPQAGLMSSVSRSLHRDYPSTDPYRALMHFAMLQTGKEHISHLITGLPVGQFLDRSRVAALEDRLRGVHRVTENLEITVERVTVGAQPAGAMLAAAADPQLAPIIEQGFVMVVDPGFFSMDWLTLQDGQIVRSLSGTNMRAVSLVLERAAELIGRNAGGRVPRETLEHAVRSSAPTIFVAGQAFDFWPTLEAAAQEVGADSVREIVNQLRVEDRPLDLVLVTGGGAHIYKSVLDAMLPGVRVQVMPNPVLANARGFWLCGS